MQQKSLVYICILVINLISSHIVIAAYEDMLEISPATINLGTHILGKKVPLELTITNRGVKPVKITKIKTSCGCVDIKINSSTINVGESIKLHGMVDSLYREGLFEKKYGL